MKNRITELFNIDFPLIQAGMIWCSGWELASVVSEEGGLGIIGSGSMYPDVLDAQLTSMRASTRKPYAVNLPLLYPEVEKHIDTIIRHRVPIVFTSAGSPSKWTATFKDAGIVVVHVVSNLKFALKAQDAGVDAVVAEGFEAGGHNGREETTTFVLVPLIAKALQIPVIAAGGIATGAAMAAAFALGAEGAQIGSRFVASNESSAHALFKSEVVRAKEGDTTLTLKELAPVRLLKNAFYHKIAEMYRTQPTAQQLAALLGRGRAKKGMFEGDLVEGELEIGQVSSQIDEVMPAAAIFREIKSDFYHTLEGLSNLRNH
jgi:enoyl-[acyl-carrier protein] reductase II